MTAPAVAVPAVAAAARTFGAPGEGELMLPAAAAAGEE